MIHLLLHTAALLLAAAPATRPPTRPAAADIDVPAGYALLWHDEFDGSGLPDPAKWRFEGGFLRNDEEQYYTVGRTENARQEDGRLIIEARRERAANERHDPAAPADDWQRARKFGEYTSADLDTLGKFSFTYGRVEARAKLPKGKGMWPAFWMLGSNIEKVGWPVCGEIDVMEWVGKEPEQTHGTVHYADPKTGEHVGRGVGVDAADRGQGFHVYAAEWTPDRIDFLVDGKAFFGFDVADADPLGPDGQPDPAANPFRKPQHILLNLAVGGAWGGEVDPSIFPQQYVVDYVRVYQRKPAAE